MPNTIPNKPTTSPKQSTASPAPRSKITNQPKEERKVENAPPQQPAAAPQSGGCLDPSSNKFDIEILRTSIPPGVDPKNKQAYLSQE